MWKDIEGKGNKYTGGMGGRKRDISKEKEEECGGNVRQRKKEEEDKYKERRKIKCRSCVSQTPTTKGWVTPLRIGQGNKATFYLLMLLGHESRLNIPFYVASSRGSSRRSYVSREAKGDLTFRQYHNGRV